MPLGACVRKTSMSLRIATQDGEVWLAALINAPFFRVSMHEAFYELLRPPETKEMNAMAEFVAGHPDFLSFGTRAKSTDWTASYAQELYSSLDAWTFVDGSGVEQAGRRLLLPEAQVERIKPEELGKRGDDFLEREITERVAAAAQRWKLIPTLADPGDQAADPSRALPAGRRTIDASTLIVQRIEAKADASYQDIKFEPTILPRGIHVSDDPFPAARLAAYAKSFDFSTLQAQDCPDRATDAQR